MAVYIGLMSGTSLDGVDAVAVRFGDGRPRVLGHVHRPYDEALRTELLQLNQPGEAEMHRAALAANGVARHYAQAVKAVRALAMGASPAESHIVALGAHGQTVRHRPLEFDGTGYTVQLLNGALLAELAGIDVVCDFRSRDLAAGGQGAPLVPAFHAALFAEPGRNVAVLNLGGIANLTLLPAATPQGTAPTLGFDCGPGNALLDGWIEAHLGQRFDADGAWAATGQVHAPLLARLLADPFFDRAPPKSTGRDLFHRAWLEQALAPWASQLRPQDVQATLAELTATAAVRALHRHLPGLQALQVCGGGAFNGWLMRRLGALVSAQWPGAEVQSTAAAGVPPDQVEALAFAWLARAFVERSPGNLPAVTGARGTRVLGALYPA